MPIFCTLRLCLMATLFAAGVLFILISAGGMLFFRSLLNKAVQSQTHLGVDSTGADNIVLKMYRDPPYDIRMEITVFSVQNAEGVVSRGERARVTEKGPYTFRISIHKENVSFAEHNSRLFYRNVKTFFFDRERSCPNCSLEEPVTVPNILLQKLTDIFEQPKMRVWLKLFELMMGGKEKPFITVPVGEWLFQGYEEPFIGEWCDSFFLRPVCKQYNVPKRIGLFYGQNGTDDGVYEVGTGWPDVRQFGRLFSWNGMEGMLNGTKWYGEGARRMNGTDGQLFPPDNRGQPLQMFLGQFCRSFDLEMREKRTFSSIPVHRYVESEHLLDTGLQRQQGFCNPNGVDYFRNESLQPAGCAPSGLLDLSSCLPDSPRIFWSAPHFANSPDAFRHTIDGMNSSPSDSTTYDIDLEPITGTIVHMQQRFQLSLGLLGGTFKVTKRMRNMIMPLIRVHQIATVDPGTKDQLMVPITVLRVAFVAEIVTVVLGAAMLLAVVAIFAVVKYRKAQEDAETESPTETKDHSESSLSSADI